MTNMYLKMTNDREQDRPNSLSAARTCETIIIASNARIYRRPTESQVNANSGFINKAEAFVSKLLILLAIGSPSNMLGLSYVAHESQESYTVPKYAIRSPIHL